MSGEQISTEGAFGVRVRRWRSQKLRSKVPVLGTRPPPARHSKGWNGVPASPWKPFVSVYVLLHMERTSSLRDSARAPSKFAIWERKTSPVLLQKVLTVAKIDFAGLSIPLSFRNSSSTASPSCRVGMWGRPPLADRCPRTLSRRTLNGPRARASPVAGGAPRCASAWARGAGGTAGCQAREWWGEVALQPCLAWWSVEIFKDRSNLGSVMVWAEVLKLQAAGCLLWFQSHLSLWCSGGAEPGQVSCWSCAPLPGWQSGR